MNGFDCGVFCIANLDWLMSGEEAGYSQSDMPYLRSMFFVWGV